MSRMQRDKGARGEREVVRYFQDGGFQLVARTPNSGGLAHDGRVPGHFANDVVGVPGLAVEVKRQERLSMDEWSAQVEADAPPGAVPVVVYRRSHQPWRVSLRLEEFVPIYYRSLQ